MGTLTTTSIRGPHWRTVRTVTGSLQALIGPRPDPRNDRPLAGPEAMIDLPCFGGLLLRAPLELPEPAPALAAPAPAVYAPAVPAPDRQISPGVPEPNARELPWWVKIMLLPALAIAVAMMTVAP